MHNYYGNPVDSELQRENENRDSSRTAELENINESSDLKRVLSDKPVLIQNCPDMTIISSQINLSQYSLYKIVIDNLFRTH